MTRKPTETVQVNLRIKESLRRRLEREAQHHLVSLNKEMTMRLEDSFQREAHRTLEDIAAEMKTNWLRTQQNNR